MSAPAEWVKEMEGHYSKVDGPFKATVVQEGELWRSIVTHLGAVVDIGQWDGRGSAFRCANGAIVRARGFLYPLERVNADEDEEEEG